MSWAKSTSGLGKSSSEIIILTSTCRSVSPRIPAERSPRTGIGSGRRRCLRCHTELFCVLSFTPELGEAKDGTKTRTNCVNISHLSKIRPSMCWGADKSFLSSTTSKEKKRQSEWNMATFKTISHGSNRLIAWVSGHSSFNGGTKGKFPHG